MAGSRRNGGPRIMQERSLYTTNRAEPLRAIENGSLQPDQALPSERELCQRYGTSRMTVRHAVTELESLGSVYRMQGKGTFVSGRKLIQQLMQVSGYIICISNGRENTVLQQELKQMVTVRDICRKRCMISEFRQIISQMEWNGRMKII